MEIHKSGPLERALRIAEIKACVVVQPTGDGLHIQSVLTQRTLLVSK